MTARARRTSCIDLLPRGSRMADGFRIVATAADEGGAEARIEVEVAPGHVVTALSTAPEVPALGALVGEGVRRGFRARAAELVPEHAAARTPLFVLLDDLPVAALISGYADLYAAPDDATMAGGDWSSVLVAADICAGWASDGHMVTTVRREGRLPVSVGPPPPEDDGLKPLPPGGMRRRRRLDATVKSDGTVAIDAMFRDTHTDAAGSTSVLHEWWVDATVDPGSGRLTRCEARPVTLPWGECPGAAGSAGRLVGQRVEDLREVVQVDLRGTSTCTHLNDLLRSLADVPVLLSPTRGAASRP